MASSAKYQAQKSATAFPAHSSATLYMADMAGNTTSKTACQRSLQSCVPYQTQLRTTHI